jgi:hypothetical protein
VRRAPQVDGWIRPCAGVSVGRLDPPVPPKLGEGPQRDATAPLHGSAPATSPVVQAGGGVEVGEITLLDPELMGAASTDHALSAGSAA